MTSFISEFVFALLNNFTFVAVTIAWFLAQSLKVIIYRFQEGEWNLWHFFEAGGMPSAHSAAVTSLTMGVALTHGWSSPLFTVSLVFALIVMYDATGVRRAAGKQAEMLNKIIDDMYAGDRVKADKLKEILGHDPIQVVAGVILAIMITLLTYYVYFTR